MGTPSEEFLGLTLTYLQDNHLTKPEFIKQLSTWLTQVGVFSKEDVEISALPKNIFENFDWDTLEDSTFGEDKFFNGESGLYTSLKNALKDKFSGDGPNDYKPAGLADSEENKWWTNAYWNESLASLMQILAQKLDPESLSTYENSGLLIELIDPEDHVIDTDHLRAGIVAQGATAALRVVDIVHADAAASFEGEVDFYEYGTYFDTITFAIAYKKGEELITQECLCEKILFNTKAEEIIDWIRNGIAIDKQIAMRLLDKNKCVISGGIGGVNWDDVPNNGINVYISNQGEETYRFKIVKKPWVIPWYNLDGNTYASVRGDDKHVSALTNENQLDQTNLSERYINLLMPRNKRKVEVEDLNRNFWVIAQVLAGISVTLFDDDGAIKKMIKGILKEIGQLWENMIYLWSALALLAQKRYYKDTYVELLILPFEDQPRLKYDNFSYGDADQGANTTKKLEYLVNQHPYENIYAIVMYRSGNYEHNYFNSLVVPGMYIYDRNEEKPQWRAVPVNLSQNALIINAEDFISKNIWNPRDRRDVQSMHSTCGGKRKNFFTKNSLLWITQR